MSDTSLQPLDWQARAAGLDSRRSFIVQAPAGSGKTELLIQRLLALLAEVDEPEEILALTFTRKAANEMKGRLVEALDRASLPAPPEGSHAWRTWDLARRVLEHQARRGWQLQENPGRLQLQTIDSFCAGLTRRMPWLSGFGDQPQLLDDPADLYREAAEQLLQRLESGSTAGAWIERLVRHLDNRQTLLRDLLVDMLGRRDQWLRHLLDKRHRQARQLLEEGLRRFVARALQRAAVALGDVRLEEVLELGAFAASRQSGEGASGPLSAFAACDGELLPEPGFHDVWLAVAELLLTVEGKFRRTVTVRNGFPAGKEQPEAGMKERMLALLGELAGEEDTLAALLALRELPGCGYEHAQWEVLEALIELLPLAAAELETVFRRAGCIDFIGVAAAARAALGVADNPEELLLRVDSSLRHILVDEFQDTSYGQYELLLRLTSGWNGDDGRTLFVVGDPMQSIYRFREADVGLYLRCRRLGLGSLPLERLNLTANFRSQAGLVEWFNSIFAALFPSCEDELTGAVTFAPAQAILPPLATDAVTVQAFIGRQDQAEALAVVELVRQTRAVDGEAKIAILVRSRSHLLEITAALRAAGLRFQADEIDPLCERPTIQDLVALTRALLHPADRVAWLAVLRAPWCGLRLAELYALCAEKAQATVWEMLTAEPCQGELFSPLSANINGRLGRVCAVLRRSLAQKGRLPLRQLVESTWLALDGPACGDEGALADAERFFVLLAELDEGGDLLSFAKLDERLAKLYASADPLATPQLQVLTIHKAKGLEFDTVILPGLGRKVPGEDRTLLRWLEHPDFELLLAPLPAGENDAQDRTYAAIGALLKERVAHEMLRLFYVATTRAKRQLHLLGHLNPSLAEDAEPAPAKGTLLAAVWSQLAAGSVTIHPAAEDVDETASAPFLLRRLPAGWSAPPLLPAVGAGVAAIRQASEAGHATPVVLRPSLRSEEGRIVGSLVHLYLERIGREGLDVWPPSRVAQLHDELESRLIAGGIPAHRRPEALTKVQTALQKTLEGERGRWILSAFDEAACEWALSGVVDGVRFHASIDRTFVVDGERWVIDYKTSAPAAHEKQAAFLQREKDLYQPQLQTYARLLTALEPQRRLRCALYFPLVDAWEEIAV